MRPGLRALAARCCLWIMQWVHTADGATFFTKAHRPGLWPAIGSAPATQKPTLRSHEIFLSCTWHIKYSLCHLMFRKWQQNRISSSPTWRAKASGWFQVLHQCIVLICCHRRNPSLHCGVRERCGFELACLGFPTHYLYHINCSWKNQSLSNGVKLLGLCNEVSHFKSGQRQTWISWSALVDMEVLSRTVKMTLVFFVTGFLVWFKSMRLHASAS